jgi:hypothetical protein
MKELTCSSPVVHLIGEIVVSFQEVEWYIDASIWQMITRDDPCLREVAKAITAEMSFDRKVHALSSIYRLRFPDLIDDTFTQLIKDLDHIQQLRNGVIHSMWYPSNVPQVFGRMKASAKAKRGFEQTFSSVKASDLSKTLTEIEVVSDRFSQFAIERIQKPITIE